MENGKVSFWVKDYKDEGKKKVCVLEAEEFIRRFLLHILPAGFRKIRMFGFLANRSKMKNLELIREFLHIIPAKIIRVKKKVHEIIQTFFGVNILTCQGFSCKAGYALAGRIVEKVH
ncbi:MAG: transposase [Fibrobacteria bacterium]|nr:transposase [Fibrobacteria bacterium]